MLKGTCRFLHIAINVCIVMLLNRATGWTNDFSFRFGHSIWLFYSSLMTTYSKFFVDHLFLIRKKCLVQLMILLHLGWTHFFHKIIFFVRFELKCLEGTLRNVILVLLWKILWIWYLFYCVFDIKFMRYN